MAKFTYSNWRTATKVSWKTRSSEFKALDKALAADAKNRTPQSLAAVASALDAWKASKADWSASARNSNGAMVELDRWVKQQQGFAVRAEAADFAARRVYGAWNGEYRVSIDAEQVLTYPPSYQAYCDQWFGGSRVVPFPMKINFGLIKISHVVQVNVRALAVIDNVPITDDILNKWKTQIESAWNCATLRDGTREYDLQFNLIWVRPGSPGPYFEVKVHQPPALTTVDPSRDDVAEHARSGTPHLGQWGLDDKQAVVHEFGHMIGNPDEYFCTGFTNLAVAYSAAIYNHTPFTTNSIMNNTRKEYQIYERHFALVVQEYIKWQKAVPGTVKATISKPCAAPKALLEYAMAKRRRGMGYED